MTKEITGFSPESTAFAVTTLNDLRSDSSRTFKKTLLTEAFKHEHRDALEWALKSAYEPGIVYGVARTTLETLPVPSPATRRNSKRAFDTVTVELLRDLSEAPGCGLALQQRIADELEELEGSLRPWFERILLRDLDCGIAAGTINAAKPGFITEYPYMRCSLPPKSNIDKRTWETGVISQLKANGMFVNIIRDAESGVRVITREGLLMRPAGDEMNRAWVSASANLRPSTVTHGELLVSLENKILPRHVSNGLLNAVLKGGELPEGHSVIVQVWDQIPLEDFNAGKCAKPYAHRLRVLLQQISGAGVIQLIETKIVSNKVDALAHYKEKLAQGEEGTVLKHPDAIWKDGTSKDQVKLKLEVPVELRVVGFESGEIGTKYEDSLGALVCESECLQLRVNVNGRTDAMRAEVWANKPDWLGAIVTVKSNEIMAPKKEGDLHSLFLPVFVERRLDKSKPDSLEEIKEQFAAAIK